MRPLKKVQGLSVASVAEGTLLGKVDDLQFDLASGHVYGFRFKQGVFGRVGGAPADAVTLLGGDLVFVRSAAAIVWDGTPRVVVAGRAWATEYRGRAVMTRRGASLGEVEDLLLALGPARIVALILDGSRAIHLDPERVSLGRDSVVVADAEHVIARPAEW